MIIHCIGIGNEGIRGTIASPVFLKLPWELFMNLPAAIKANL